MLAPKDFFALADRAFVIARPLLDADAHESGFRKAAQREILG